MVSSKKMAKRILNEINAILWDLNPIGFPVPTDEYENWTGTAYRLLSKKPSMDEVLDFLETFETAFATPARKRDALFPFAKRLLDINVS